MRHAITLLSPLGITLATLCALALGSCGEPVSEPPNEPPNEPVVLGALYNLSGDQAALDQPSAKGARLAVAEANQAGGVLGRPVELVVEDGTSTPAVVGRKAADILQRFPRTAALFGLSDTDMVLAAAPVAAEHGRIFVTSGATSPRLPEEVPDDLFLACFGDNVQAAAGAEWAYEELGARTAIVLYDDGMSYTQLLHGYFEARFAQLGGEVLRSDVYPASDPSAVIDPLSPPDLIYLAVGPEDVVTAVQSVQQASLGIPILGGDSFDLPTVWREHPEVEQVFFTTHAALGPDNADPRVTQFRDAYAAAYDGEEPDAFAALGYDTARLLLRAIADAGSDEPAAVKRALAAVTGFEGVTGTLGYPAGARIPHKAVSLLQVADGTARLVRQQAPEHVPAP